MQDSTDDAGIPESGIILNQETVRGGSAAARRDPDDELVRAKRALEARSEELATSLSLLTATLESTADGIVALDLEGHVVSCNTKFVEIWDFPADMLERRDSREMMDFAAGQMKDAAAFRAIAEKGYRQPETETLNVIELRDGRSFERSTFPRRLKGACVGVVVNFHEVTERRRAEAALRISEEKYRLLWATAEDAFVIFGRDNIIREANAAVARTFGYEPHEVVGRDIAMLQPERLRPAHREGLRRYLESGVRRLNWSAVETTGLHRDGREFPVEIAFNHLQVGGEDIFAGFIRDITERKRVEQARAVFEAIVSSSHDAIVTKTLDGIITSWNSGAERIFGYTAAEAVGKPILLIIPPERADEEPRILARQARGEGVDHFETVRVRKDGRQIHVSITLSPIKDSHGKIVGISKIARDITEQKLAQTEREELLNREQAALREARAADRTKDEFLATLSHELRTPLTAILGWSQMITAHRLNEEDKVQGEEIIQRNALLLAHLVDDILDVSRIITGKLRLDVRPVQLSQVIAAAVESVHHAAAAKQVRLLYNPDFSIGPVSGDPGRLQQVVWNLLANAIKFTPSGGTVQVRLEKAGANAVIAVADTGAGIALEVLPHVFERFRQADQSSTRNHGGLGLGLAIVRHIVENHGGSVEAESAGQDQGSTFTVSLPLMTAYASSRTTAAEGERRTSHDSDGPQPVSEFECPPELQGLRVLVVDDEADARGLVKTVLESCGAVVTTAGSAAEALSCFEQTRPDVLVSDVGMPGEDGYSLIRQIRALGAAAGGETPAAALTAYAREEDRVKALQAGFQIHLPKPVVPTDLVSAVAGLAPRAGR